MHILQVQALGYWGFNCLVLHIESSVESLYFILLGICGIAKSNCERRLWLTWFFIKTFWYLVHVFSWNKEVSSRKGTWNKMSWGCFDCEIKWKKSSSNISSLYFMLTHNGNQALQTNQWKWFETSYCELYIPQRY